MARTHNTEGPEILEAVLKRIRQMTREEWIRELAWRPEGVEETWRTQQLPEATDSAPAAITPAKTAKS
jgi:hypothetical protein